MRLPTIKVHHPHATGDYAIINLSDFNPALHRKFGEDEGSQGAGGQSSNSTQQQGAGTAKEKPLEKMNRAELNQVAAHYQVAVTPNMKNAEVVAAIKAKAGYTTEGEIPQPRDGEILQPRPEGK